MFKVQYSRLEREGRRAEKAKLNWKVKLVARMWKLLSTINMFWIAWGGLVEVEWFLKPVGGWGRGGGGVGGGEERGLCGPNNAREGLDAAWWLVKCVFKFRRMYKFNFLF